MAGNATWIVTKFLDDRRVDLFLDNGRYDGVLAKVHKNSVAGRNTVLKYSIEPGLSMPDFVYTSSQGSI